LEHKHGHEHCASDEKIAADVEKHGLSVMLVAAEEDAPRFAYSIGLWRSFNHPEILVFGLNEQVAGNVLNELASRIRAGGRCETGRDYEGLLEGYNCVFRDVPRNCYPEYFGYAMHFYQTNDFPALQLVWPDKAHRWPWDIEFEPSWIWQQPLLEHWPEEKTKNRWVFNEYRNLGVITTTKVLKENHPILLAAHEVDGDWQFLCGTTTEEQDLHLVCLNEIVQRDPSVNLLADLPEGWCAWRDTVRDEWQREPLEESDDGV
jgi:hypothetical protein